MCMCICTELYVYPEKGNKSAEGSAAQVLWGAAERAEVL